MESKTARDGIVGGRKPTLYPVGTKFGHQVVTGHGVNDRGKTAHVLRCCCGSERMVLRGNMERSKSCGCMNHKYTHRTHGQSYSRTYYQWRSMKLRCTLKSRKDYPNYGGRGISYCREWENFEAFLSDMGECPDGLQLDRIDNDGDYAPHNCRWVTPRQNANNRRGNRRITNGEGITKTLIQWARETGIPRDSLAWRLDAGWDVDKALTSPVKSQKNNRSTVE